MVELMLAVIPSAVLLLETPVPLRVTLLDG